MKSQHHQECLAVFAVIVLLSTSIAASPHKHSHSGERMEDGSYSPRDAHHHDGGEHHSEFDHEAILGSVKDAEEFDNLPPEEAKKRLALLVKKMDRNQDQFVDRHELKAWILRSFRMLSEEEAADRFEDIDENRDDRVTWDEYLKDTYGMESEYDKRDPLQYPHAMEEEKLIMDDRDMFKAADINEDGVLNGDEFVAFISPEEHPHMLPIVLKQSLRDKDSNKDGKIDFQEFVGGEAKTHDKEWLITEKTKFDEDFDKDKDGFLNSNEILSWIVPSNE